QKSKLRLTNPEEKVKVLHTGTVVAQCEEVLDKDAKYFDKKSLDSMEKIPFGEGEITVSSSLTDEQREQLLAVLNKHKDRFAFDKYKLGKCNVTELSIDLTDDIPVRQAPYRYSPKQREQIQKEIEEMILMGVVEESTSDYSSPVVLVKKHDGGTRMCVDLRKLNKKIKSDNYPMTNAKDCLHALSGSKWFAILDLNS
ncbi:uncharacterized protein B4U80_08958, partial [Leptotrombidium deliense]